MVKILRVIILLQTVAIIVLCVSWRACHEKNSRIVECGSDYAIYESKVSGEYDYEIYGSSGIIKKGTVKGVPPYISYIGNNLIEITISGGTDCYTTQYYDFFKGIFSEEFNTPIATDYGKTAYILFRDGKASLAVQDIFDKSIYYKEFPIETPSAIPIRKAVFMDSEHLMILLVGADYAEQYALLDL